jgi:anti-sigma-K factor RskA
MADHPVPHPDLGAYVLGGLEPAEQDAFVAHLRECDDCAREVAELSDLPARLADAAPYVDVPTDLEARVFARVDAEPAPSRVAPISDARSARRRLIGPSLQRMLAVAAGFLLVVGAVGLIANLVSGSGPSGTTIQLVSATGGRAHGEAHVRATDEGRAVDLEVDDLAPAPRGYVYECWFVGAGDTLAKPNRVSVGTFSVDRRGHARVRWTSATTASRFPKLGVTLEPEDGNPQRTGAKVLVTAP